MENVKKYFINGRYSSKASDKIREEYKQKATPLTFKDRVDRHHQNKKLRVRASVLIDNIFKTKDND